jgi:DNA repair ATPase RecN
MRKMEENKKITRLLSSLKEILPDKENYSTIENLIKRVYHRESSSHKVRQRMNRLNSTIKEVVDDNLVKEISDLDLLIWGQIDDLMDELMNLGRVNEMTPKRIEFYIDRFSKLKKLADKAEIELNELLRKIGLLLISLNHEVTTIE